jgi:hypothetical protein
MKKLTLTARESTIETAKRLAEENGTSISAMFERFILYLASRKESRKGDVGPVTRKATGLIELSVDDVNGRAVLENALLDRHERTA